MCCAVCTQLCLTVACQAPSSMEFSRQGYWSGLPFPSQGDLPNPGIKPGSPTLQADSLPSEPPGEPEIYKTHLLKQRYSRLVLEKTNSSVGKESTCSAGDPSSIPGLGRSAAEGIG